MDLRPLPHDPDRAMVQSMFDLRGELWFAAAAGEYQAAAVEAMKADGSSWQQLVALEWPGRENNGTEKSTIRLLISPEDAIQLGSVLAHAGAWLLEQAGD